MTSPPSNFIECHQCKASTWARVIARPSIKSHLLSRSASLPRALRGGQHRIPYHDATTFSVAPSKDGLCLAAEDPVRMLDHCRNRSSDDRRAGDPIIRPELDPACHDGACDPESHPGSNRPRQSRRAAVLGHSVRRTAGGRFAGMRRPNRQRGRVSEGPCNSAASAPSFRVCSIRARIRPRSER